MTVKRTGTLVAALLASFVIAGTAPAVANAHPLGPAAAQAGYYDPAKPGPLPHEGADGVASHPKTPGASAMTSSASVENGPITRSEVLTRSRSWIDEHVMYSQSGTHTNQYGSYRPDCSGFVSMAWNLSASLTTATLPSRMDAIGWGDLRPGDALWRTGHIALFLAWNDAAKTQPIVREEFDFGNPAVERAWTTQSYIRTFTPMRYRNIVDDIDQPKPMGDEGIAASASYRYGGQEHMFSKGADGSLKHSYNTGTDIESESYPGQLAGEPVAYVAGDQQHVFALLTGNRLGHWFWRPTDADPIFEIAATDIAGNPTGYAFGDQLHAFARGTDGKLKHLYWAPGNEDKIEETLAQSIAGDPVAYVWGDQQHVFGRTADGHLGHWYWQITDNDPNYGVWGGSQITGTPTGYAFGEQQHVLARGADGTLKHFYWTPEEGVVEEPLNSPIQGDPIAYVWNDQQHVFARTPGNELGHWWWTPEDNAPQYASWGGNIGANLTGFATENQQNVYGRTTDGTLMHWYWSPGMGSRDLENWGQ
ncbi:hypothetical protein [Amycolatopsis sp. NBC_01286]|uniref:hypothetical protein n=1 Tax=Amycolatopsis sp. NBC_01286 TaxID=2903560 RepID=UPI002E0D6B53|nr:DUF346 domain-containing protein [Amycolatopsis sp. NBC_01286]